MSCYRYRIVRGRSSGYHVERQEKGRASFDWEFVTYCCWLWRARCLVRRLLSQAPVNEVYE